MKHTRLCVGRALRRLHRTHNVRSGGHACPDRFTCVDCGHFRSDASYLPELKPHLRQLLANREQIMAATDIQDWARAKAELATEEITQLRDLVRRDEHELDELDPKDQERIKEAIDVVRNARQTTSLPTPGIRARCGTS